jgi:group I intron endonuclease
MIVYKIQNKINGKIYIGMTKLSIERRVFGHLCAETYIGRSLRKYGLQSFDIEIIDLAEDREALAEIEVFWIFVFNSMSPNGYNLTEGGEGSDGYKHTEETLQKIITALNQPEVKARQIANMIAAINNPEIRAKISANLKTALSQPGMKEKRIATSNRPEVQEKMRGPRGPQRNPHGPHGPQRNPHGPYSSRRSMSEEGKQNNRNAQNRPEVKEKVRITKALRKEERKQKESL